MLSQLAWEQPSHAVERPTLQGAVVRKAPVAGDQNENQNKDQSRGSRGRFVDSLGRRGLRQPAFAWSEPALYPGPDGQEDQHERQGGDYERSPHQPLRWTHIVEAWSYRSTGHHGSKSGRQRERCDGIQKKVVPSKLRPAQPGILEKLRTGDKEQAPGSRALAWLHRALRVVMGLRVRCGSGILAD